MSQVVGTVDSKNWILATSSGRTKLNLLHLLRSEPLAHLLSGLLGKV